MAYKSDTEALCDRIYDSVIAPELWAGTLEDIAAAADCAWAGVLTRRSDSWIGWRISSTAASAVDAYLRSDSAPRSITTARLFELDHPGFISDHEHFTEDERSVDPYFQWAEAHGFRHGAATGIRLNSGDLAVVQLMRRTGDLPLSRSELQRLDRFRPHLARAALLAARWKMERLCAATEALALLGLPAVVLTGDCRVMAGNELVESLTDHLIWLAGGGLALKDAAASAKLRQQLCRCTNSKSPESASSFPAWDEKRESPLVVHMIPLDGSRRELFDGGLALVVFASAVNSNLPDAHLIRELFDLTPTEAKVAAQLAVGRSIDEIAGAHQVTVSTVRTQAKTILHKVGAHRQAELAARLGGAGTVRPRIR